MTLASLLLVLGSGLAHALWNFFAKKSEDKSVFLWAMFIPSTIVLLPTLLTELAQVSFTPKATILISLSLLIQSIYAWLLSNTYKQGDLSQVYPIMRGTSTLLIPVLGVVVLQESLPFWGWMGILSMLTGFIVMSGWSGRIGRSQTTMKPILFALSVGLCTTCYTLVDKQSLAYLSPPALLEITNIGFILGLTPTVLASGRLKQVVRNQWRTMLIGAVLSPGSYLLFLFAVQHTQVSYLAPLREVGIVFGTLLGLIFLKEKQGIRRIAASVIVVVGIIMIATSGS
ncbi:multidrug efflux system protein MdtJ [compost metagenome]